MICGQHSQVNARFDSVDARVLRCRSWTCEHCRPGRYWRLVREAASGRPDRFVTLTHRQSSTLTPTEIGHRLSRAWRLIVARWKRRHPGMPIEYFARLELTRKGVPHLHILVRGGWIDQRWLSLAAAELLDAPVVWVEAIDNARNVGKYISKYLAKDADRVGTCKRYWRSAHYIIDAPERPPADAPVFRWSDRTPHHISTVARTYETLGYTITWTGTDRFHGRCHERPWSDLSARSRDGPHGAVATLRVSDP